MAEVGHAVKRKRTETSLGVQCLGLHASSIRNKGLYRTEADEKHRRQSICYSLCLGIDDIMWYYEERNYCTGKTFLTHNNEQDKCEIIELIEGVNQSVIDQIPPAKTEQKRVCAYCPYKTECKKW